MTEWTAPAFSTDADPTTFTDSERAVVIDVWRRVAQDYAPFDVDVTTQDPGQDALTRSGSTDLLFGTRVLITPDATQSQCGCGGRAYVDVFDRTSNHAYYQPAWVYPQALSNNAKYIAEAASHEAGHTLGLSHDGTTTSSYYGGSGGWGPIMGAPYSMAITQWSDGSYANANNLQDDVALIAANGAPLMADDAPDQATSAIPLALSSPASGLVNGRADADWYSVAVGAGTLTATAAPYWPGPDADLGLVVTDAAGQVVATAAPAFDATKVQSSVGATVQVVVPEGTYFVGVEGTGNGVTGSVGESDYGSLGWYTVTVSGAAPSTTPTASATPTDTATATPTPTDTATATPTPTDTVTPTPTDTVTPTSTSTATAPATTSPSPTATTTATATASPTPTATTKGKGGGKPKAAAVAQDLTIESTSLPVAQRRTPYAAQLVASGGTGDVVWKRTKGKLPKGLALTSTGLIVGTPTAKASKKVRFRATDAAGDRVTRWIRIRVR